ncbi:MAG: glycosyltransferase family 4 protein [Nostoc sp. C3-bin3]|nr:glycosyltransferase family 4 protein [Nostoc sp. C3-bin3]
MRKLDTHVSFVGFVEGETKVMLLQAADLFVLPSLSENFSIAIAEAMAVGLPVIVTEAVQIAPEIIKANAGLIVKGEIEDISQAISHLLTSSLVRKRLGINAKKFAKNNYNWDNIAASLINIYAAILNKNIIIDSPFYPNFGF